MSELKGLAKFKKEQAKQAKLFKIDVGTIEVDSKVNTRIQNLMKKYGDKDKYGGLALKSEGQAVQVLLEELISVKKARRAKPKPKTK